MSQSTTEPMLTVPVAHLNAMLETVNAGIDTIKHAKLAIKLMADLYNSNGTDVNEVTQALDMFSDHLNEFNAKCHELGKRYRRMQDDVPATSEEKENVFLQNLKT